ncbi:MAG: hypothetical protein J2P24_17370 [Streptosporangiales bacterium]|nr:hypothetical protein [Streptosporangiales bacterium]
MEREAGVGSSIPGHDFERAGASGGSDQGGCFEDSHPTTHAEPTLRVHESVSYCVATMPGAVPNTSTHAVTDATLRSVLALASNGRRQASRDDESLAEGRNTYAGSVVCAPVAEAHGLTVLPPADALA